MLKNRPPALALLPLLALGSVGCTVFDYARLVAIKEQELFCDKRDDRASLATYRSMADQAWATHGGVCPDDCISGDYGWGFREGFAQFVYAGGTGEPPAVPPRPYWQVDLRSEAGAAAVRSWFEGYRHGARVARDGGYRRRATLTVSASLKDCDACGCPTDNAAVLPPVETVTPEPAELLVPPVLSEPALPESPIEAAPIRELPAPSPVAPPASPTVQLPAPTPQTTPPVLEAATATATDIAPRVDAAIFQIVR